MRHWCGVVAVFATACIQVEVEVTSVCLQASDVMVEVPWQGTLPTELGEQPMAVDAEVVQAQLDQMPTSLSANVLFASGVLSPVGGAEGLQFVRSAVISLRSVDEASGLPPVDLLAFERSVGDTSPDVVAEGVGGPIDLAAYLGAGDTAFSFELVGNPSEMPSALAFDADLCFSASASWEASVLPGT